MLTSQPSLSSGIRSVRFAHAMSCAALAVALTVGCDPKKETQKPFTPVTHVVQLDQGWSAHEIKFYAHATEGTNLAPLDFVLHLPDPAKPDRLFIDRLTTEYGMIPSPKSEMNPHGLPVGFAIDKRPAAPEIGDRVYVGVTCSMCHTRQLSFRRADAPDDTWLLQVHGGPSLVEYSRFKNDLFGAFLAVVSDDDLARRFAQGVFGKEPQADDIAALRGEIREFMGPVLMGQEVMKDGNVADVDSGPGNLDALSQGYYNNVGLTGWLQQKGLVPPSDTLPSFPRMEGVSNYPPMWFSPHDTWAQWFAEIHHPGPRNWIMAVSTSEVRPPKMIAAQKQAVTVATVHFDNIAEIQQSLEVLRTPKWPEDVLGPIDHAAAERGRAIFEQQCASCHTRTVLVPNELGIVFKYRPAFDVGTDPVAYQQFKDSGDRVSGLVSLSNSLLKLRQAQLTKQVGADEAENYIKMDSRGRPNQFALAGDESADNATWPKSGAAYWAPPMEGVFATSPYFHNGSVRTLTEVLTPPAERAKTFHMGTNAFDAAGVGLKDEGHYVYDTSQLAKGNGGHPFGTDLPADQKATLIEYLKSM